MPDPRVRKLAQVLIQYSLELQPGELFALRTSPLAEELSLEVYKEAVKAGAHITIQNNLPGAEEVFYRYASDAQLAQLCGSTKVSLSSKVQPARRSFASQDCRKRQPDNANRQQGLALDHRVRELGGADHHAVDIGAVGICVRDGLRDGRNDAGVDIRRCRCLAPAKDTGFAKHHRVGVGAADIDAYFHGITTPISASQ